MAPKKPTMLQRQRALRKQQQQTKKQSSKQLPPKGQTSANSRQARGQRTSTAKAQAANQQRVIARGMEGFVRRGKAMDKLDNAAKGTKGSGTRTAGAGGGLAKRQSSAVTTRQSGKPATTGGQVQRSTGGGASSNRVQQVRVRDLGSSKPNQVGGSTPRALPPGRSGGALARTARGAASAGAKGGSNLLGRAALPLAIANQVADVVRVGRQNQRWDEYKRANGLDKQSQPTSSKTRRGQGSGNKPRSNDMPSKPNWRDKVSSSNVDQLRQGQNATTRSYADKAPATRSNGSSSNRSSRPSTSSAPRSTTAPRSQTPPKPRFTGTVDEGRKMWAEKYSSSKYDGQAIQKEAKKLLDEMKKRREDKSNAQRAGWDGNKNY